MSFLWRSSVRFAHFKPLKNYPKININDVKVERPSLQKGVIRKTLLSQNVKDTLFPATEIAKLYKENNKPIPRKYDTKSEEISRRNYEFQKEAFASGEAHFRIGEKNVYFPKARIILLRPNAKHTPYQAKFLVPRNFNRLDLRDYLFHVYGLRALNVTVQLLHTRWMRSNGDLARYRSTQYKKMTIDMEDPFVWPEVPKDVVEQARETRKNHIKIVEQNFTKGSDLKNKPIEAFDGLYKKPTLPNTFIPRRTRDNGAATLQAYNKDAEEAENKKMLSKFLNL